MIPTVLVDTITVVAVLLFLKRRVLSVDSGCACCPDECLGGDVYFV